MRPVLIVYATREGHAKKVAESVAARVRTHGLPVEVLNATEIPNQFPVDSYRAAVVCASIHIGVHEKEIVQFAKRHREELEQIPTAFLSISLAEAGAEDAKQAPDKREAAAAEAMRMVEAFVANTGWRADILTPVAGALMYSKYNWFITWVMKRIAKANHAPTDSSRDWIFTNWDALDKVADDLVARATRTANAANAG